MDMNTVKVTVIIDVNGETYNADASGSTTGNPYRLADNIATGVKTEVAGKLSDPRLICDAKQTRETRRLRS